MTSELYRSMPIPHRMLDVLPNNLSSAHIKAACVFGLYTTVIACCAYRAYKEFCFTKLPDDSLKLVKCKLWLKHPEANEQTLQRCKDILDSVGACAGKEQVLYMLAEAYRNKNNLVSALEVARQLPLPSKLQFTHTWCDALKTHGTDTTHAKVAALIQQCTTEMQTRTNITQISPFEWHALLEFIQFNPDNREVVSAVKAIVDQWMPLKERVERFCELVSCCRLRFEMSQVGLDDAPNEDLLFMHLSLAHLYASISGEDQYWQQLAQREYSKGKQLFSSMSPLYQGQHLALYIKAMKLVFPNNLPDVLSLCDSIRERLPSLIDSLEKHKAYMGLRYVYESLKEQRKEQQALKDAEHVLGALISSDTFLNQTSSFFQFIKSFYFSSEPLKDVARRLKGILDHLLCDRTQTDRNIRGMRSVYLCCSGRLSQQEFRDLALRAASELHNTYRTLEAGDVKDQLGMEIQGYYNALQTSGAAVGSMFGEHRRYFRNKLANKPVTIEDFKRYLNMENWDLEQKKLWLEDAAALLLPRVAPLHYKEAVALLADAYLEVDTGKSTVALQASDKLFRTFLTCLLASAAALGVMNLYLLNRHQFRVIGQG